MQDLTESELYSSTHHDRILSMFDQSPRPIRSEPMRHSPTIKPSPPRLWEADRDSVLRAAESLKLSRTYTEPPPPAPTREEEDDLAWTRMERELKLAASDNTTRPRVGLDRSSFSVDGLQVTDLQGTERHGNFGRSQRMTPRARYGKGESSATVSAMTALQQQVRELHAERKGLQKRLVELEAAYERIQEEQKTEEKVALERVREKEQSLHAMERSCHEKELELHTRLAKSQEKVASLKEQLEAQKARVEEFEKQKLKAEEKEEEALRKVKDLEKELKQTLKELNSSQSTSQRAIESHRSYVQTAEKSTIELEEELEKQKAKTQELLQKQKKREEFLQSVISLNEGLVQKLAVLNSERGQKGKSRAGASKKGNRVKGRKRCGKTVHEELKEANFGKPVPFLLGTSPGDSFSIYGQTQAGIHDDEAYGNGYSPRKVKPSPVMTVVEAVDASDVKSSQANFSKVVKSLEEELWELREAYNKKLQQAGGTGNQEAYSELDDLLTNIEIKTQQIAMLRRYNEMTKFSKGRIPVRSPKAFNKKVNSLRALHNFKVSQRS